MPTTPTDTHAMTMAGLNLIQQALSIYDRDLKLVVSNAQFRDMFSLPRALTVPGAEFVDTIRFLAQRGEYGPIDDIEQFVIDRVETARAFAPHYMERTRANGRTISVEGSPLPQGGWVTVYTDITSTKRAEQLLRARSEELSGQLIEHAEELSATNRELASTVAALEEAKRELTEIEARTRLVTEMMPAHIAHIGPDRVYTYSNRRVSSVMPGSRPDPVGLHGKEVLGPQPWRAIAPHLDRAYAGAANVFEFTHAPSSRRIRVALTPDPSTGGVYILSTDVTEEAQTRASLQQHRRREIAARMISGLAHDFSNLLTIILGTQSRLARLVEGGAADAGQEAPEMVAATLAAARRGGALLNRIADMTSTRALAPRPTDVASFLHDFETLARATLPDGVTLSVNTLVPDAPLMLDPGLLQDSLLNLVLNARDACGPSGAITLTANTVKDTWLAFTLQDSGPGFSDEALDHAFEPFFTTKGGEGSGLGLASVYDNTKLAGGSVRLGNGDAGGPRGGQVTIRLPLRPAPHPAAPGLALLVEDSDDLRATIRGMLTEQGHSVIEATTVDEALALADQLPDIALILSDISLEGTATGIDLAQRLPRPHPPLYLMTSLPPSDPLHQTALALAPVLRKPFSSRTLATALGAPDQASEPNSPSP